MKFGMQHGPINTDAKIKFLTWDDDNAKIEHFFGIRLRILWQKLWKECFPV